MRIYHVSWPTPKHVENSPRGIRYAARHGFDAVDLDMQITRDDVIIGCHWGRPMERDGFRDPQRQINPRHHVRTLTWEQVSRLVAGRRPRRYRIHRIERLLRACARHGVIAYLEPKDDERFEEDWPWQHIRAVADDCGAHVRVRSLRDLGGHGEGIKRVEAAKRNGFKAVVIR